jgi:hypothetical protein
MVSGSTDELSIMHLEVFAHPSALFVSSCVVRIEKTVNLTDDQVRKLEFALGYVPSWVRGFPPHTMNDLLSEEALQHIGPHRDQIQYLLSHFDARQLQNIHDRWEVVNSSLYLEMKTMLPGAHHTAAQHAT